MRILTGNQLNHDSKSFNSEAVILMIWVILVILQVLLDHFVDLGSPLIAFERDIPTSIWGRILRFEEIKERDNTFGKYIN
jgi:hypothetical protein